MKTLFFTLALLLASVRTYADPTGPHVCHLYDAAGTLHLTTAAAADLPANSVFLFTSGQVDYYVTDVPPLPAPVQQTYALNGERMLFAPKQTFLFSFGGVDYFVNDEPFAERPVRCRMYDLDGRLLAETERADLLPGARLLLFRADGVAYYLTDQPCRADNALLTAK